MGQLGYLLLKITKHYDKLLIHWKDYGKRRCLLRRYKFLNNMKDIKKFPDITKHLNVNSSKCVVRQIGVLFNQLFGDLENYFKI